MSARAFKLFAGTVTGSGFTVLYTCPASAVVIVKTVSVRNTTGGNLEMVVGAYASGSTVPVNWVNAMNPSPLGANVSLSATGMWALAAGDQLWIWSSSSYGFVAWVSGTKLT